MIHNVWEQVWEWVGYVNRFCHTCYCIRCNELWQMYKVSIEMGVLWWFSYVLWWAEFISINENLYRNEWDVLTAFYIHVPDEIVPSRIPCIWIAFEMGVLWWFSYILIWTGALGWNYSNVSRLLLKSVGYHYASIHTCSCTRCNELY